jgi:hypothetical protein
MTGAMQYILYSEIFLIKHYTLYLGTEGVLCIWAFIFFLYKMSYDMKLKYPLVSYERS